MPEIIISALVMGLIGGLIAGAIISAFFAWMIRREQSRQEPR